MNISQKETPLSNTVLQTKVALVSTLYEGFIEHVYIDGVGDIYDLDAGNVEAAGLLKHCDTYADKLIECVLSDFESQVNKYNGATHSDLEVIKVSVVKDKHECDDTASMDDILESFIDGLSDVLSFDDSIPVNTYLEFIKQLADNFYLTDVIWNICGSVKYDMLKMCALLLKIRQISEFATPSKPHTKGVKVTVQSNDVFVSFV